MENDTNIMQCVADSKYTEFSTAVKNAMKDKLSNSETISNYTSEFDKIQHMKSLFAKINKVGE